MYTSFLYIFILRSGKEHFFDKTKCEDSAFLQAVSSHFPYTLFFCLYVMFSKARTTETAS